MIFWLIFGRETICVAMSSGFCEEAQWENWGEVEYWRGGGLTSIKKHQ